MTPEDVKAREKTIEDIKLSGKLRTFNANSPSTLEFEFQNADGLSYDLTDDDSEFRGYICETVSNSQLRALTVEKKDAAKGLLSVRIPSGLLPGIYRGAVQMIHDGQPILSNAFRLYVSVELSTGVPSLQEIRMYLRDSYPEENSLLEGLEFEDSEIVIATERALRYFNEVPPHLDSFVATSTNFPWRYHLLEGILGQLYRIAANSDRKNSLQYSAGGLSVNDNGKEQNYLQASQMHWQTYQQFVDMKKYEMNMVTYFAFIP